MEVEQNDHLSFRRLEVSMLHVVIEDVHLVSLHGGVAEAIGVCL